MDHLLFEGFDIGRKPSPRAALRFPRATFGGKSNNATIHAQYVRSAVAFVVRR